jgi:hypothetical protein
MANVATSIFGLSLASAALSVFPAKAVVDNKKRTANANNVFFIISP